MSNDSEGFFDRVFKSQEVERPDRSPFASVPPVPSLRKNHPPLAEHCHSRPFPALPAGGYVMPQATVQAPDAPANAFFVQLPDVALRCAFVPIVQAGGLVASVALSGASQIVEAGGRTLKRLECQFVPADGTHPNRHVTIVAADERLVATIYVEREQLATLIEQWRRDICPALALHFDIHVSGNSLFAAGGGFEGGRLRVSRELVGRLSGLTTGCPRILTKPLTVEPLEFKS